MNNSTPRIAILMKSSQVKSPVRGANNRAASGTRILILIVMCCWALSAAAQTDAAKAPSVQDVALARYYDCIERYAQKYARTAASSGDIADAATSSCGEQLKSFTSAVSAQFGGGQLGTVESLTERIRSRGRSFGVQSALEAKYPMK